jgi:hypothetical protein
MEYLGFLSRSHLKNVFDPKLSVGPSFQLLEILEYACGLKLGPALILGPNPIFEMTSKIKKGRETFHGLKKNRGPGLPTVVASLCSVG